MTYRTMQFDRVEGLRLEEWQSRKLEPMTDDEDDYWRLNALTASAASKTPPALDAEAIDNVEPLDDQFGIVEPLTVPAALRDALFGQLDPTEAEIYATGGDTSAVPNLRTYAI